MSALTQRKEINMTRKTNPFGVTAVIAAGCIAALCTAPVARAHAHPSPSDASLLSVLPIAVSVAAPVMVLSAGAMLTVVAAEATSGGTV